MPSTAMTGDGQTVLLVPTGANTDHLTALAAWHRARSGVTLLIDDARWTGVAALDRSLVAGTANNDDWTLARMHGISPLRAVTFPPRPGPSTVFLDRDGTIIEERDFLSDPDGVTLLPGTVDGLRALAEGGVRLVVISNQSGVGSGRFTLDQLGQVNTRMQELLANQGISLDAIYCCIHRADAGCDCRKPATGLVRAASTRLGLELGDSVVVGDKASDLGLARALGVPAFLVTTGYGRATLREPGLQADYVVDDLTQLARICSPPGGLAVEVEPPTP